MTIEEMRALHQQALREAEAKQTELRLVLASRYRELVGSSDEVLKMRERAQELHELVHALPTLMAKLQQQAAAVASSAKTSAGGKKQLTDSETKTDATEDATTKEEESKVSPSTGPDTSVILLRRDLSLLPRVIHRALDQQDVHEATIHLLKLFRLIAQQTDEYPLASALSPGAMPPKKDSSSRALDPLCLAQMRMTFLHIQTLPAKIRKRAKHMLYSAASYHPDGTPSEDDFHNLPTMGAQRSASALSTLDLLETAPRHDRPSQLLDLYFDAKAHLLQSLLNQLSLHNSSNKDHSKEDDNTATIATTTTTTATSKSQNRTTLSNPTTTLATSGNNDGGASTAEDILSKIVLILQYDIIVHPYQIFVLRKFPCTTNATTIMNSLPMFVPAMVQAKASNFLAAHLPLIRTKVKSVLVDIAGTTASALGKIRQSLYDKTDGVECMQKLDTHAVCTWDEAVHGMVDRKTVLSSQGMIGAGPFSAASTTGGDGVGAEGGPSSSSATSITTSGNAGSSWKFSLWSVLFSHTFSSLVHSLLTSSFHSVHSKVASSLRLSLANAPPLYALLPHEAYRNTLLIASELDTALLKVSEDAHELLVHAEERVESERRLRQSLYVQTCEIMGRLLCELRRMLAMTRSSSSSVLDAQFASELSPTAEATEATAAMMQQRNHRAVRELIVGRLCHLLKFRLTGLPTLLHANSSPAVLQGTSGMISLMELQSAFELADDDEDGLITFEEAMEAFDSAFSGTQFHGADMVRETLLLQQATTTKGKADMKASMSSTTTATVGSTTSSSTPQDVTLNELILLAARGLRHEESGRNSALGTIQASLDDIIATCFQQWAEVALLPAKDVLDSNVKQWIQFASTCSESEYRRVFAPEEITSSATTYVVSNISPHLVGYLLHASFVMNQSISPSDSLLPVPSVEYAAAMGIQGKEIPRMMDMIRWALLSQSLVYAVSVLDKHITASLNGADNDVSLRRSGPSGLIQLQNDVEFVYTCFFERNKHGFGGRTTALINNSKTILEQLVTTIKDLAVHVIDPNPLEEKRKYVLEVCDLFLSSVFGEDASAVVPLGDFGDAGNSGMALTTSRSAANPLLHTPLPSSCRFPLLPIQSDRTLSEVQLRGKYKDKEDAETRQEAIGTSVMGSGFGFFSSMLKKT